MNSFVFLMIRRPPTSTLFPSTTLSRSSLHQRDPDDRLDALLRDELRWEAPAAFTAQLLALVPGAPALFVPSDRKSTRLNSSHANISYAVFCLTKNNDRSYEHTSELLSR